MVRCRILGHRFRFAADGQTMRWACQRECGAGGEKRYESAADAERYARVFDREDRDALGRNRLTLSLLPLRMLKRRRR